MIDVNMPVWNDRAMKSVLLALYPSPVTELANR